MARSDSSEHDCMAWDGQFPSNADALSAQAVRVVSNEVLLNREIKKGVEQPKGMRLRLWRLFCQFAINRPGCCVTPLSVRLCVLVQIIPFAIARDNRAPRVCPSE